MSIPAKTDSDTPAEASMLEIEQIEHWIAMRDPVGLLKLIDSGDQSLRSISTLLVQIVMKKQTYVDVERLKTMLFLDWFDSLKSDEDVKNLLRRSGLDTSRSIFCLNSFKEFCMNKADLIKPTLSENVPTPADNTIGHDSNYESSLLAAYETSLANYNEKNPNMQLRLPAILRAVSDKSELAARTQSAKLSSSYAESDTQLDIQEALRQQCSDLNFRKRDA
ncbi:hypothetical protein Plhal304r1_c054g0139271 [Plasmopara halstedii]